MRKRCTAWALLVVATFCHEQRVWAAEISEFVDFSLRTSRQTVPGRLYVPPEAAADPTRPRPLMVFLHGAGAVGDNNATPVQQTPAYMLEEAKRRGAFLYVPQTGSSWAATTVLDGVMTMTDRAVAEMNADADRL
jgi:predicted peptidase